MPLEGWIANIHYIWSKLACSDVTKSAMSQNFMTKTDSFFCIRRRQTDVRSSLPSVVSISAAAALRDYLKKNGGCRKPHDGGGLRHKRQYAFRYVSILNVFQHEQPMSLTTHLSDRVDIPSSLRYCRILFIGLRERRRGRCRSRPDVRSRLSLTPVVQENKNSMIGIN